MATSPLRAQTFEWAESAGGTSSDTGKGIAVDASGNSYVTGWFDDAATMGTITLTSTGAQDIFVGKLSDAPVGGACSPDADNDGIEDILDEDDTLRSIAWADNSTTPVNFSGSIIRWNLAEMTVCDLASPEGVEIETVTGGPATASSNCPSESMRARNLAAGERTQFDCLTTGRAVGSAPIAQATAVVGDVEVELVHLSTTIASVMLPEGNAVRFTQDTLLVSAPATNTVPLMMYNGPRQDELAPGQSMTIVDDVNVPAVSQWGLLVLALALLSGVTFKAARRRVMQT